MFRTVLLELFLKFRPFKKTANIRQTTISAQILHESNTKWRVAPKRKKARQLSTCLGKPLTAQRCSHRLIEPSNHGTIERKISNRARIWSAAG